MLKKTIMWIIICVSIIYLIQRYCTEDKLWEAIFSNNMEYIMKNVNSKNVNKISDKKKNPPLILACWRGKLEIVKYLLKIGASPNKCSGKGSVVSYPIDNKQIEGSAFLEKQETPLITAIINGNCSKDNKEIIKLLIKYGADINRKNMHNLPPLYYAVYYQRYEETKILLENGANIHDIDFENEFGIRNLYQEQCSELLELLMKYGINIDAKNKYKITLEELAYKNNQVKILKMIEKYRGAKNEKKY